MMYYIWLLMLNEEYYCYTSNNHNYITFQEIEDIILLELQSISKLPINKAHKIFIINI